MWGISPYLLISLLTKMIDFLPCLWMASCFSGRRTKTKLCNKVLEGIIIQICNELKNNCYLVHWNYQQCELIRVALSTSFSYSIAALFSSIPLSPFKVQAFFIATFDNVIWRTPNKNLWWPNRLNCPFWRWWYKHFTRDNI